MGASKSIKQLMTKRRISRVELADKLNTTPQVVSNKLYRDTFSFKEVEKITALLDGSVKIAANDSILNYSVFRKLFNDKEKIIELYNALSESSYGSDTSVEIVTLEDVLYDVFKNDLAFIIENKLVVLVEYQNTINENIPVKMLIYLAKEYEKIIKNDNIYKSALVEIPEPELYVLYNSSNEYEETELKLSDAFISNNKSNSFIDLKVKVININVEKNHQILTLSRTLNEYSILIQKIKQYLDNYNTLEDALRLAVKDCIDNNILKDFLEQNLSELISMLLQEFDAVKYIEVQKAESRQKEKLDIAKNALIMGLDIEQIEKLTGLNREKILNLK